MTGGKKTTLGVVKKLGHGRSVTTDRTPAVTPGFNKDIKTISLTSSVRYSQKKEPAWRYKEQEHGALAVPDCHFAHGDSWH